MNQMKEQDKSPENIKWSGDRQTSRKRIQNNDSEDDPGPQKKNGDKYEKMQEMFNKDLEELKNKHLEEWKNKQTEMNNTMTEMKNTLGWINSRITEAEERISDLEDRMVEFTAMEQKKRKKNKKKWRQTKRPLGQH